jgi:EmrB/QacA subfamily drug resistance transporter
MSPPTPPTVRKGPLLAAMVLAVSVVLLGTTILNVALPDIRVDLDASTTGEQWILNAYTLTFAGFLLVAGVAGDRFGHRRILLAGLAVFAVTAAVGSVAPSVGVLIAMRALMGIAAAAIMPMTLAIIAATFPAEERARAITIWAASSGFAIALGPLIGGALLTGGLWWGSVLLLVALLCVAALAAGARFVPHTAPSGVGELRLAPVVGSVAGIGLLVAGVLHGGQQGDWTAAGTLVPGVAGLLILAALVAAEARHPDALVDVALFRSARFSVSVLVLTLGSFSVFGFLYLTTFYLQVDRGYTPLQTGLILLPLALGLVVAAPLSRRVTAAASASAAMAVGMLLTAAAMATVATMGQTTAIALFMLDVFVLALGFGLVLSPGTTTAMSAVPAERMGAGSALLNTMRQLGSALGVAILGSLLWSGYRSEVTPDLAALPEAARAGAGESLAATLAAVPAGDGATADAARAAFVHAMHTTTLIAAVVCALAAVAVVVTSWSGRPRSAATVETGA